MDKEKNLRDLKRFDSIGRGIAIVLSFVMAVVSFYSVYWHMTEGKLTLSHVPIHAVERHHCHDK